MPVNNGMNLILIFIRDASVTFVRKEMDTISLISLSACDKEI